MPLLTRLSDSFWSLVSPAKTATSETKSPPQTLPRVKRAAVPPRKGSLADLRHDARSMSADERVDTWRVAGSSSSGGTQGLKRKAHNPADINTGRRDKMRKSHEHDSAYAPAGMSDDDDDVETYSDDEHVKQEAAPRQRRLAASSRGRATNSVKLARSSSSSPHQDWSNLDTDMIEETNLVVEDEGVMDPDSPSHSPAALPSPTTALESRGLSTSDLQAQGWDADHITLVQRIALRGYEPLLPDTWKLDFRFLPDALFTPDPPATSDEIEPISVIHSVRDQPFRGSRALERLLELGGRVRDRILLAEAAGGTVTPEQQVRRSLSAYQKWAHDDAAILSARSTIPLLVVETQPLHVAPATLQANARAKLARLATRWKEALNAAVQRSIESSPTVPKHEPTEPLPTLYAIIASHTIMALVAYRPEEGEIRNVALFDWKDRDYDVWNSLALAIVVCCLRKVQMRMARETGVGLMLEGEGLEEEGEDPDA